MILNIRNEREIRMSELKVVQWTKERKELVVLDVYHLLEQMGIDKNKLEIIMKDLDFDANCNTG